MRNYRDDMAIGVLALILKLQFKIIPMGAKIVFKNGLKIKDYDVLGRIRKGHEIYFRILSKNMNMTIDCTIYEEEKRLSYDLAGEYKHIVLIDGLIRKYIVAINAKFE